MAGQAFGCTRLGDKTMAFVELDDVSFRHGERAGAGIRTKRQSTAPLAKVA